MKKITVAEQTEKFSIALNKRKTLTNSYTIMSDNVFYESLADDSHRIAKQDSVSKDDYLHIFRNDSTKNALQCYLKHSKQLVYILANTKAFQDFSTDIEHTSIAKNATLTRYIVSYDNFEKFIVSILAYDSNRQSETTTASKVDADATA